MFKVKDLLELQKELDDFIIEKRKLKLSQKELLNNTFLALYGEVAELAEATKCYKHWSNKNPESKERQLEEYVDVLHFVLSIANQLGFSAKEIEDSFLKKRQVNIERCKNGY